MDDAIPIRKFSCRMIPLFILFIFLSLSGMSQVTITGTVTASDIKETLPGATIVAKGTTNGAVSDIDGHYKLSVTARDSLLEVAYVGYKTMLIPIKGRTVIDIMLDPTKTVLNEVLVIGYGTIKKSDLSGAVGSVKAEDITRITALNPVASLQGNVAGVQINNSGIPGKNPDVLIRGVGTFNNTKPIYVVDGVILDDISFLNSQDIISMEVLKDASATAIYGSRGANGVIMVTTKMGKGEEKVSYNFTGEVGIQRLAKKISLLNGPEFATVTNIIRPGTYNNVNLVNSTDWQDQIFQTAPIYNFQLSATGSSKSSQYYISGGYFKQEGIVSKSKYERISLQFNNTYNLQKFLKLGNFLTISPFSQQVAPDVVYMAYRADPIVAPYYPDGTFAAIPGVGNPLATLAASNNYNKGVRGVGNIFAEVSFLKSFTFKSSYGIDLNYNKATNFTPAYTVYNSDGTISQQQNLQSDLFKSNSYSFTWLWENTLTYEKVIKKHSINALLGYTMQNTTSENMELRGENIIRDESNFWYITPGNIYDPGNNVNTINSIKNGVDINQYYSMISYLLRVNYVFNKRYILTATFRSDGSSKFAVNNRYAYFPSFAAGWNISQENFLKEVKFISRLKLRASWGKLGNDKIAYDRRYAATDQNILVILGNPGSPSPGISYGLSGNPNLRWEVTTQTDVGLESGFFNDRLTVEFDFYNKQTDDILIALSTPGYFGNGGEKITYNAASVLNRGYELTMGWRDKIGKLKYNIGLNGSWNHNDVLKIGGSSGVDSVLIGGDLGNGQAVTRTIVGLPIGSFYGYRTAGIFQNQAELNAYPHLSDAVPGDLRFEDVNKDGILDSRDRVNLGSPIPTFIFGMNVGIEIFGIDFSLNLQGQTGNKIFNAKEMIRPDRYNFEHHVVDGWTTEGSSNTEPKPSFGGNNYLPSDKFIQDGSYLRIRSLIVGYTLPIVWTKKVYIQKFRIYMKAENLHTFTKYTGYTPELIGRDILYSGIDFGAYPVTAVYSAGINLTF